MLLVVESEVEKSRPKVSIVANLTALFFLFAC